MPEVETVEELVQRAAAAVERAHEVIAHALNVVQQRPGEPGDRDAHE